MNDPFAFSRRPAGQAAPAAGAQEAWGAWSPDATMPGGGGFGAAPAQFGSPPFPGQAYAAPHGMAPPAPQQQHPSAAGPFGAAGGFGGTSAPFNIAEVASNPMAQLGMKYGKEIMQSSIARYLPGAAALWNSLRYYFDVNNRYVVGKLAKLLFPWTSRKWERTLASDVADSGSARHSSPEAGAPAFAAPVHDENAPDLYIPLMAFTTFVLFTGLLKGTRMKFTPEELVNVTSSSAVAMVLEVVLLKAGLYFSASACPVFDLVSYAGYKYVGLVLNSLVGLVGGAQAYYVTLFYTASALAYFLVNTLMPVIKPEAYHAVSVAGSQLPGRSGGAAASAGKNYFVLAAAGMQYLLMWWLGHSGDL